MNKSMKQNKKITFIFIIVLSLILLSLYYSKFSKNKFNKNLLLFTILLFVYALVEHCKSNKVEKFNNPQIDKIDISTIDLNKSSKKFYDKRDIPYSDKHEIRILGHITEENDNNLSNELYNISLDGEQNKMFTEIKDSNLGNLLLSGYDENNEFIKNSLERDFNFDITEAKHLERIDKKDLDVVRKDFTYKNIRYNTDSDEVANTFYKKFKGEVNDALSNIGGLFKDQSKSDSGDDDDDNNEDNEEDNDDDNDDDNDEEENDDDNTSTNYDSNREDVLGKDDEETSNNQESSGEPEASDQSDSTAASVEETDDDDKDEGIIKNIEDIFVSFYDFIVDIIENIYNSFVKLLFGDSDEETAATTDNTDNGTSATESDENIITSILNSMNDFLQFIGDFLLELLNTINDLVNGFIETLNDLVTFGEDDDSDDS